MSVPLFATRPVLEPLLAEVAERQRAVLDSGRYILGPEVEAFEAEFAASLGAAHCVGVANGTDAITIALRALGIGHGDEVVVPAITFYASVEAIVNAGADPVLCDIDPRTFTMTRETVEAVITERTRALLPVHLFGNPAPIGELGALAAERDLVVCEDAAQAAGTRYDGRAAGTLGHAGTFSFFPAKNLGGFGDGGAIVTDDGEVAAEARRLRFHASEDKQLHTGVGYNSRLDELQAASLRVLLPHLPEWIRARRAAAEAYASEGLGEVCELPVETGGGESSYHLYVVLADERDALRERLGAEGVDARTYYGRPMHHQPGLDPWGPHAALPAAEAYSGRALALPMGPALDREAVRAVVAAARAEG